MNKNDLDRWEYLSCLRFSASAAWAIIFCYCLHVALDVTTNVSLYDCTSLYCINHNCIYFYI